MPANTKRSVLMTRKTDIHSVEHTKMPIPASRHGIHRGLEFRKATSRAELLALIKYATIAVLLSLNLSL